MDYLRTLALARIVLDNFDNLQASWVTQGGKVGQLSLAYGANDMGSVMIEENVVRAAGAAYCMDEVEIVTNVEDAGFTAKRRNMHYEILGEPVFRERDVPRLLSLATARVEGDTSVPEELKNYPARSRAGKAPATCAVASRAGPDTPGDARLPIARARRHSRGWSADRRSPIDGARSRSVDGRAVSHGAPARPRAPCVAAARRSSTRTPTSSCRTCAAAFRRAASFTDWVRPLLAARRTRARSRTR